MILTDDQIKELIKHPANEDAIMRGCQLYKSHIRHVKGMGVEEFFVNNEIKGYENEEEKLLRHKTSRATTVPIFASALGTFDKAFSASGYSSYSEFKTEDKDKTQSSQLKAYLSSDLGDGMNLRQWMQYGWGDKIHYDFNGVMMVELPAIDMSTAEGQQNQPYIIFKSIHDIHDYGVDGMNVEYLILKTDYKDNDEHEEDEDETAKFYRVIDDVRDVIVKVKGKEVTILNSDEYKQLENIWGYVPAIVISSQRDACTGAKQSYIWEAIGTADDYLLDSSIANVSKKKHGFPQRWSYQVPCKACKGEARFPYFENDEARMQNNVTNWISCKSCNGLGSLQTSPAIAVMKPLPDLNNPDIGEPFGYVVPDIESMRFQIEEMAREEKAIHEAIWTVVDAAKTEKVGDKTATASVLDVSAKQTKLNKFSANGEKVEQFIVNAIGKAIYKEQWGGNITNWGRKYYILTENEIERLFKDAKEAGVSSAILKSYLEELIYVRYSTDPVELSRQLKLFELEPFVEMTVKDVQELKNIADADRFLKTYFNDYIEIIERTKPEIMQFGSIEELQSELQAQNKIKMQEAGVIDANGNPVSTDKEADARAELRGSVGGVQAIAEMVSQVAQNPTMRESVIAIIETFYGVDNATAQRIVGNPKALPEPEPKKEKEPELVT